MGTILRSQTPREEVIEILSDGLLALIMRCSRKPESPQTRPKH
jgi:hypothetical protein